VKKGTSKLTYLVIDCDRVGSLVGLLIVSDHHGDVESVQTSCGERDADVTTARDKMKRRKERWSVEISRRSKRGKSSSDGRVAISSQLVKNDTGHS